MIVDLFTRPWAQWSYDHMREYGPGERAGQPLAHLVIQAANVAANVAPAMILTSMSNPHYMSYAYKGLDPMKFGMKTAMRSRKEFQMASSRSFQIGETALKRFGPRVAKQGGKFAFKAIPGIGWALLAYDAYDLVANQRLFGIQL
jgi:hypothetical protein